MVIRRLDIVITEGSEGNNPDPDDHPYMIVHRSTLLPNVHDIAVPTKYRYTVRALRVQPESGSKSWMGVHLYCPREQLWE